MSDHLNPQERIGAADRDAAVTALSGHLSAARLDDAEFAERSERVSAARTRGDLDAIFADLPALPTTQPAAGSGAWAPGADPDPVLQQYQPPSGASAGRPMDRQQMAHEAMTHDPTTKAPPEQVTRMLAISGGLATVVFLVLGFAFGAWAWAWIVFLIPGLVRGYYGISGTKGCG